MSPLFALLSLLMVSASQLAATTTATTTNSTTAIVSSGSGGCRCHHGGGAGVAETFERMTRAYREATTVTAHARHSHSAPSGSGGTEEDSIVDEADAEAVLVELASRLANDPFWGLGGTNKEENESGKIKEEEKSGKIKEAKIKEANADECSGVAALQTRVADRDTLAQELQDAVDAGRETPAHLAAKAIALFNNALHQFAACAAYSDGSGSGQLF